MSDGVKTIYSGGYLPDIGVCNDPSYRFYGWLMANHPDGQWMSLCKAESPEAERKLRVAEEALENIDQLAYRKKAGAITQAQNIARAALAVIREK